MRGDKILLSIGFIAVGLKKPSAQAMRDLQKIQYFFFGQFHPFVGSLVANPAHQMEGGGNIRGKRLAPLENV
ncbi:hypothetical protein, partial [uncultured Desulfovibrio sp.]|uniref:hypothetical protein n=1 Tax=uncultured Desulfovibrio sp. TaxID=167968 RepID=UPI002612B5AC